MRSADFVYQSALARVEALADWLRNSSTIDAELAARNIAAHQPAFWTIGSRHCAPDLTLLYEVNNFASIEAGQKNIEAFFAHNGRDVYDPKWLDALLPLNAAAVDDLSSAYVRAGTFRTRDELIKRTERKSPPLRSGEEALPLAAVDAALAVAAE